MRKLNTLLVIKIAIIVSILFLTGTNTKIMAQAITYSQTNTGFYNPTGVNNYYSPCGKWLGRDSDSGGCYISNKYHIGIDLMKADGSPVFAINPGVVVQKSLNGWEGSNVALMITHTLKDGSKFNALYGHIQTDLSVGDVVSGGVEIGRIGNHSGGDHLHFGIRPDTSIPSNNWGMMPESSWANTNGFVDPENWVTTKHPKCENGSSQKYLPGGQTPTHPDGSIVKAVNDPQVYVIKGNTRRPIPSAQRLYELYGQNRGFGFQDVVTVSSQEINKYTLGATVNAPLPDNGKSQPDGRLIKASGSGEVAIVTENGKRRVFSGEAFLRLGYSFCNVAVVSDYYSYPKGQDILQ